ncbi:MAG: right-handed parallel beta-helix repeat-containing protein, partial [Ignavibacteria bacterium]|nr:right-handed parallel beta-helix repeat-containing protein [Ignavibacteria bacterium]
MKAITMCRSVFWTLLAGCLLTLSANGQINVTGTNTYPADHNAAQAAIDLAGAGGTVILHGTFDFGTDGGVQILQPDVTLMGGTGGAVITGQGKVHVFSGLPCLISVEQKGCTVKDLTITSTRASGSAAGVVVWTLSTNPADNPVIIQNNMITVANVPPPDPSLPRPVTGIAVYMRETGCPMMVVGNAITGTFGVYARFNTGDVLISKNTISSVAYGTYVMQNTRECIVTDNTVYGFKWGQGIHVCTTEGYGKVLISQNAVHGAADCINIHHLGMVSQAVPAEISDNYLEPTFVAPAGWFSDGVWGYANLSPLNIVN